MNDVEFKQTLKKLARKNRKYMTNAEMLIWNNVLKGTRLGYRFLRQTRKDRFIIDFYCPKLKLAIEIDGSSHENKDNYDREREIILMNLGIKTIRYTNEQVLHYLESVFNDIKKQIEIRLRER